MPKKIGKYELGKTLGTGTFSKVKHGVDTETGLTYAIKIIDKAQLAKEHMEEQLKREIAVMKLLRHDHIVQLKEVLQTQKHIYIMLELVTGGELFEKIVQCKKFEEDVARRYFQQLIMGVHYCHQQGIAHRDLKPENLLLDANDDLKITDFGLSNLQRGGVGGGGTLLQTVCGTPNYVAPEVLKEKGYNGITADIWSCGVILFVMLAGFLPFDDPNMNALFNKIERGDFRMARHFSAPVQAIINKMLVVEPEKRATMPDIIDDPWFQINFDRSKLEKSRVSQRVSVTNKEVEGAVSTVDENGAAKAAAGGDAGGLDAFSIIGRLNALSVSHLSGPTKDISRFVMKGDVVYSKKAVNEALVALKGNPKKTETSEIKGFINAKKGLLTYVVTPLDMGEHTLVEIKHARGDLQDFNEFFQGVQKQLGPLVVSKPCAA
eukprot:TRINITY_DN585_c0_g1_i1.p1 TRINITY_DN585_c0_g1~~TRINITY_DN585_c0_g1_i1.p1  ORF type:complete len:450 (+),score=216.44 TRINITY_DN585_c0_g1_i1:49-1350(+)